MILIPLKIPPFESAEGIPSSRQMASTIIQLTVRLSLNLSLTMESSVSISEMDEVMAAKKTRMKKIRPIIVPPNISSNTLGKAINIIPAPGFCISIPAAETAGTIIRPARKAMPVSNISILCTEDSTLTSFFM